MNLYYCKLLEENYHQNMLLHLKIKDKMQLKKLLLKKLFAEVELFPIECLFLW